MPRRSVSGTSILARLLALVICISCIALIARLAMESAPMGAARGGDCVAEAQAAIGREKAEGKLTAQQAIMRRQKIKAECG
ncbi:MAG: hypothetical protein WAS21_09505 [Geminicoccaceae bacterium]